MASLNEDNYKELDASVVQQVNAEDSPLSFSSNNMSSKDFARYVFGTTFLEKDKAGNETKTIMNIISGEPHKMTHMSKTRETKKTFELECKSAALSTYEQLKERLEPFMYSPKLMYDGPSLIACAKNSYAKDPTTAPKEYKGYINGLSIPNQDFIPGHKGNMIFVFCSRCFKLPKHKQSSGRPNASLGMEHVTIRQIAEIEMVWTLPGQWNVSDQEYDLYFGDALPDNASEEDKQNAKQLKVRCDFIVHHLWPHDYACCSAKNDPDGSLEHCKYSTWEDLTYRKIPSIASYGYGVTNFDFAGVFGDLFDSFNEQLHLQLHCV